MFNVSSGDRIQGRARDRERQERRLEQLRDELLILGVGRQQGSRTPATPATPALMPGRMPRTPGAPDMFEMPDRMLEAPKNLPPRMPAVLRTPGGEYLHPTSLQQEPRRQTDLIQPDEAVGIIPDLDPFIGSVWTYTSQLNQKHKNKNCSVLGNLGPVRNLARKIKYTSLNPSIYGNKYSVLANS